ncbi:hypothetical protein FB45DRAFT_933138 [Roridomyces roridus]|uniref:MYND-type domain-containing protein n=1 Tax=Roridomyces roridus TaxID=1738132 RepID=A0AAD7BDH8_9AGAR|nr:hypothetical protein FB45DRAFT_933138 [Roridomyces roridus]
MTAVAISYMPLPLPGEAISNPEKWNKDWETVLQGRGMTPQFCFECMISENRATLDQTLAEYSTNLSGTCHVQHTLTLEAKRYLDNDLEARWLAATPEVRRKHLLAALAGVCSKSSNLNRTRSLCVRELRLESLASDGRIFIDLLRYAMLDDASVIPRAPKYIVDPDWDDFAAKQGPKNSTDLEKVSLAEILMLRTKLICYVLDHTIRLFFDLEPYPITINKSKKVKDPLRPMYDAFHETIFGSEAAKARNKLHVKSTKERLSLCVARCSSLGCDNVQPDDGSASFRSCERCYTQIQRQVFYCSRECQRADWELRHRAICGKLLSFDDVATLPDDPFNQYLRCFRHEFPLDSNYVPPPPAAEALVDPEKWNSDWETFLQAPGLTPEFYFDHRLAKNKTLPFPGVGPANHNNSTHTAKAQYNLTLDAIEFLNPEEGLAAGWLAARPEVRRKHLLAALVDVCSKSETMHDTRAYCGKELRLEPLSSDGEFFLDLLRSAMLDDTAVLPELPTPIGDPDWDGLVQTRGIKTDSALELLTLGDFWFLRTQLICHVLHYTIRLFSDWANEPLGIPVPLPEWAINPESWDRAWGSAFDSPIHFSPTVYVLDMVNRNASHGLQTTLASYPYLLSNTCSAQYYLTRDARLCLDEKDFKALWLGASPDERRPHVLEALAAVCRESHNLNMARAYCAEELRVEMLCDEGEVMLDLLRSAMFEDGFRMPKQPRYITSPTWEEIFGGNSDGDSEDDSVDDLEEVTRAGFMLLRTKLICYVLDFTLRSFCGLETPILTVSEVTDILECEFEDSVGMSTIESIRERRVEFRVMCSHLKCSKLAPADGSAKFQRCVACFSQMKGEVFYCSRKCQVADWKVRHKKTCGKVPTFDDVSTVPRDPVDRIVAAVPIFFTPH